VNLNLDRFCNFRCIYCQVEPRANESSEIAQASLENEKADRAIDLQRLAEELNWTIEQCISGALFQGGRFHGVPEALRRLNDIALSGDGEPTASPNFTEAVAVCAEARRLHRLDDVKLVLITNASLLHRPSVRAGLEILDRNHGEIWAKLDAGTEAYFAEVARSAVAWRQILDNLRETARTRPIVLQTLFMRIHGQQPLAEEITAYVDRLREILAAGGRIKLVQIHTVARQPAESFAAPLTNAEVDAIAETIRHETHLPTAAYYGSS
jgi:wyosine [tRNA(Phe)-imidazoG37] synthetase (radical SAM superfamily)